MSPSFPQSWAQLVSSSDLNNFAPEACHPLNSHSSPTSTPAPPLGQNQGKYELKTGEEIRMDL
jgi:hypothetical protein